MIDKGEQLLLTTSVTAEMLGVHPSTVKRWADEGILRARKTEGGHRRFHLREVLSAARDREIRTVLDPFHPWEANVWLALTAAEGDDGFGRVISLALHWLARGETDLLGKLFFAVGSRERIAFSRFLDEGVRGFMAKVGAEWRGGRLQVGEEHMATQVILEALLRIRIEGESWRGPQEGPADDKPVAVVGSMEGDHHDLGAQTIRAILEREGWKVYYLGPNVPLEEFASVQQAQVASLVCISFSPNRTPADVQRAMRVLGEFYRPRTPFALALGGSIENTSGGEMDDGPFELISFSNSAQEFQSWLRTHFQEASEGKPRRVA